MPVNETSAAARNLMNILTQIGCGEIRRVKEDSAISNLATLTELLPNIRKS